MNMNEFISEQLDLQRQELIHKQQVLIQKYMMKQLKDKTDNTN